MTMVVRTASDPAGLGPAIRAQIARMDPEQSVLAFWAMEDLVEKAGGHRRFQMALVAGFALIALLLASIGVYGLMAHRVAQRNRELGVRLALGARPRDVVALVLRNGLVLAAVGTALGLLGALFLSRGLQGLLFGVSPLDPATYAGVAGLLVLVAGLSAYLPSRHAAKVDPLVTLHEE
jgi:ABC-type antimicrobial peptide transport system permease subunit